MRATRSATPTFRGGPPDGPPSPSSSRVGLVKPSVASFFLQEARHVDRVEHGFEVLPRWKGSNQLGAVRLSAAIAG